MGLRAPRLCRHQVLHLHLRRLGLPAGRHPGRRLHPPVPDRRAHLRAPRPRPHPPLGDRGRAPVPRLHRRLRREGADLPVPHLVTGRLCRGTHRRRGPVGRSDGQARDLRDHPFRSQPLSPGHPHPGSLAADTGGDRHPLRGPGGLCPARPEAAAGVLVPGPDRLHRAGHLRPQQSGTHRRGAPDGQPRVDHHHAVHRRRVDLRTPGDLAGVVAAGPAGVGTGDGRRLHRGHAGLHRRARAQRVRGRVPRADRHVHRPPVVGGGGHHGGHRGRHLPAVGLPAGIPRGADAGRHQDQRPRMERTAGGRPPDHPHRPPRRVPEAGARPDHPVGRPAGRPRGPGDPHPDPGRTRSGVGVVLDRVG